MLVVYDLLLKMLICKCNLCKDGQTKKQNYTGFVWCTKYHAPEDIAYCDELEYQQNQSDNDYLNILQFN